MVSSIAKFGVQDRQLSSVERWTCFAALFFLGFTATFNQFKAAPAIQFIGSDLGMSVDMLSQIMGVYSIAGMILAYPGMLIMQRFGVKFSIVVTSVLQLLGSLVCVFATDTTLFLIGRTLEGIAYGLICVIGPNIMPRLFPLKNQGLCMGIWSQWTPVGVVIAFFTAPMIFEAAGGAAVAFSWHPIWFVSIAMEVVSIAWLLVSCKMPAIPENELLDGDPSRRKRAGKNFLLAGIVVCAFFFVWVFDYVANINTLYPTFLQNVKGLSVFDSSMLPNWTAIISIPLGIAFGVVADKLNFRKWMIVVGYLLVAVCMGFFYFTPGTDMTGPWTASVIMGLCGALVPTGTRAITPVLVPEPKKTDFALATMAFATGVAQVVGGYVVSPTIAAVGWQANAQFILAPLAVLAAIAVILFVKSDRKVHEVRLAERAAQEADGV
ncbi:MULTISPECIES: MFS transporter [Gordonibacter]|uniref:MFS transporter n=1 Tax=Gordonibacter faecis TaxID=3047475 RepID=A0ABT7DKS8_9ACTN|nr:MULTISPECIES: MFS transporter [unclassified Gordonibacter]MDJ1650140.1 MFS transporter [Gordonibacter sp. KGMB12511]HIW75584.1 MFS transporter [Candidatus Gordonibacter avicola]